LEEITNYNNFYEFSEGKEEVARLATSFKPSPWNVEVSGLVNKPKTYAIEDLLKFPRKSAFTGCAAWKPGRWSSPGLVSPSIGY